MWTVEWKLDSLKQLEIEPGSSFPLKGKWNKINKNSKIFLLFLFHLLISTFHVPTKKQPLVLGFQGQKQVRRLRLLNKIRYSITAEYLGICIPKRLFGANLISVEVGAFRISGRDKWHLSWVVPRPFWSSVVRDVIKKPKTALPLIKTDVVQSTLLGSVCRTFLFFPGLSFRFLNATSLPAPSERKVILGVERSLNLTSFGTDSPVGTCFSSLPFDEFSIFLETERIKYNMMLWWWSVKYSNT